MEKKLQQFDNFLKEFSKTSGFSGGVQLIKNSNIIYKNYFGYHDKSINRLLDDNSLFRFYSFSKPFTALAILKLMEEGRLSLDDLPKKYLSYANGLDERITIKSLLQHTSGLKEVATSEAMSYKWDINLPAIIKELVTMPLDFEPNTSDNYCNTNYILLGLIVESITKQDIKDYLNAQVFTPLGMKNIIFITDAENTTNNLAKGYTKVNNVIQEAGYVNFPLMFTAGSLAGTMEDFTCFAKTIINKTFLKKETWQIVFTPSSVGTFGLGCNVANWGGRRAYTHTGGYLGFRNLHIYLPDDDFDILVFGSEDFLNGRADISSKVYQIFFEEQAEDNPTDNADKGFAS